MRTWKELKEEYGMMWELTDPALCSVWRVGNEMQRKLDEIQKVVNDDLYIYAGSTHRIDKLNEILSSKQTKKPFPRDEDWEEGITN